MSAPHTITVVDLGSRKFLGGGRYVCNGMIYSSLDGLYGDLRRYWPDSYISIRLATEDERAYWDPSAISSRF